MKTDLEQINKDMSFGISFSQTKRNDHARELCTKVGAAIEHYPPSFSPRSSLVQTRPSPSKMNTTSPPSSSTTSNSKLLAKIESGPNETLTEQNEHNISAVIFYD